MAKIPYIKLQPHESTKHLMILSKIVLNLRHYQNEWDKTQAIADKDNLIKWQVKADDWIEENIVFVEK
jgi:hypothetical protein